MGSEMCIRDRYHIGRQGLSVTLSEAERSTEATCIQYKSQVLNGRSELRQWMDCLLYGDEDFAVSLVSLFSEGAVMATQRQVMNLELLVRFCSIWNSVKLQNPPDAGTCAK